MPAIFGRVNNNKPVRFPARKQGQARFRARRGSVRPFPVSRPSRDTIRWPTFVAITAAMSSALFLAIFLTGGPARVSAAVDSEAHSARFGIC